MPSPVIYSQTLRPQLLNGGTNVSPIGGPNCLADDSDSSYAQVSSLDPLHTGAGSVLQFPGLSLPSEAFIAMRMRGRYEMVSSTLGAEISMDQFEFGAAVGTHSLSPPSLAYAGGGIVDVEGAELPFQTRLRDLFPWDETVPRDWMWGFPFVINPFPFPGYECDFRIYEIALIVRWYIPIIVAPGRRLWPRTDDAGPALGRIWPPPNTPQAGRGIGPGAPY